VIGSDDSGGCLIWVLMGEMNLRLDLNANKTRGEDQNLI